MPQDLRFSPVITPKESVLYLHPDQICSKTASKTAEQRQNALIRLAESVKKYGILEPIAVKEARRYGEPTYELIDGERRLRAAMMCGITRIPCRILPENDRICALSAIFAQLKAGDLSFFEQAAAFRMLMRDFSLTQEEIARRTGLSQSAVANKLRLLRLSKEEQQYIQSSSLTERHARAVLRLKTPEERHKALRRIAAEHLNVSQTEELIDQLAKKTPSDTRTPAKTAAVITPQRPPEGVLPRKFALPDLTPLYNSIERTLSIFRKTGMSALCTREETSEGTRIIISIPEAKIGG